MILPSDQPAFGITHPLGLPRPIDPANFFGAKTHLFACNQMPVPSGCLAHFDAAIYRPYLEKILEVLEREEFGWNGIGLADDPPRYCLLQDGRPTRVPSPLWPALPPPPLVTLKTILADLAVDYLNKPPAELLDLLTVVVEDLGVTRFAAATAEHPWAAEFMR
jgi:hypothetical protein